MPRTSVDFWRTVKWSLPVAEIARRAAVSTGAVYFWRRKLAAELPLPKDLRSEGLGAPPLARHAPRGYRSLAHFRIVLEGFFEMHPPLHGGTRRDKCEWGKMAAMRFAGIKDSNWLGKWRNLNHLPRQDRLNKLAKWLALMRLQRPWLSGRARRPKPDPDWSTVDWGQTNEVIALELGLPLARVSAGRRKSGAAPHPRGRALDPRWQHVDWSLSDLQISRATGFARSRVYDIRKRFRGVPGNGPHGANG